MYVALNPDASQLLARAGPELGLSPQRLCIRREQGPQQRHGCPRSAQFVQRRLAIAAFDKLSGAVLKEHVEQLSRRRCSVPGRRFLLLISEVPPTPQQETLQRATPCCIPQRCSAAESVRVATSLEQQRGRNGSVAAQRVEKAIAVAVVYPSGPITKGSQHHSQRRRRQLLVLAQEMQRRASSAAGGAHRGRRSLEQQLEQVPRYGLAKSNTAERIRELRDA